jgi:hypothetical protein
MQQPQSKSTCERGMQRLAAVTNRVSLLPHYAGGCDRVTGYQRAAVLDSLIGIRTIMSDPP